MQSSQDLVRCTEKRAAFVPGPQKLGTGGIQIAMFFDYWDKCRELREIIRTFREIYILLYFNDLGCVWEGHGLDTLWDCPRSGLEVLLSFGWEMLWFSAVSLA